MKAHKFLITIIIVTAVGIMYINQGVALVRLSYDIKEKEEAYSGYLDRNKILLYNVKLLESPARLEKALLAKDMKLEVPSKERIVLVSAKVGSGESKELARGTRMLGRIRQAFASLFALGPQAQARPRK